MRKIISFGLGGIPHTNHPTCELDEILRLAYHYRHVSLMKKLLFCLKGQLDAVTMRL